MNDNQNEDIHGTDAQGKPAVYRVVSRAWLTMVAVFLILIIFNVAYLVWAVADNRIWINRSEQRDTVSEQERRAFQVMAERRARVLKKVWSDLQDLRAKQGLPRQEMPFIYPDEPYPTTNKEGQVVWIDPTTQEQPDR